MTGPEFAAWMARLKLSNAQAADALGAGLRTVKGYKVKAGPLPDMLELACIALERDPKLLASRLQPRVPGRPSKSKSPAEAAE